VPVDVSELLKAGGGVKCCTLELHRPVSPDATTDLAAQPASLAPASLTARTDLEHS
jgi:hypothetical protein